MGDIKLYQVDTSVKLKINRAEMRSEDFNGQKHLVAPFVILTEGVHNGSAGPILYPAEELAKYPAAWNGRPLTLDHPADAVGNPISANSPLVLADRSVGFLFNTDYRDDGGKPRNPSELWINVERAKVVTPETLELLANAEGDAVLEVSTGLFFDEDQTPGVWNGEAYNSVARNFRPDHLALLPGGRGACSIADGCGGPRVNQDKKQEPATNETSLKDVISQIHSYVNAMDQWDRPDGAIINYVEDVFENYFVYERQSPSGVILYRQDYSVQDGKVNISEEVVEVRKDVNYPAVENKKKEDKMDRNKVIEALLTNKQSPFCCDSEKGQDKAYLTGLSDERLMSHAKKYGINEQGAEEPLKAPATTEPAKEPVTEPVTEPAVNKGTVVNTEPAPAKPLTTEEYVANAPKDVQAILNSGLKREKKYREQLITVIKANEKNKFSDESLSAMDTESLENLYELAHQPKGDGHSYVGNGGPHTAPLGAGPTDNQEDVLDVPVINFDEDKKLSGDTLD